MRRGGRRVLQPGLARNRVAYDQALSGAAAAAKRVVCGPGLCSAVCQSPWSSHGEGRARKRGVGRGGAAEKTNALEIVRRNAARDCLRRFDRHSGLSGTTSAEDRDRAGGGI